MAGTPMILAQDTTTNVEGALSDATAASVTADRYGGHIEDAVERTMNDLEAERMVARSRRTSADEP